jgi:hypothetical protein
MSEFKVGDKVLVECEIVESPSDNTYRVAGPSGGSFWVIAGQCKPVEPEAVEQPAKKEPTTAQKLAERTLKALWATQDQPVEPPQCSQDFRYLDKGERILASDVPVVPQVQQAWNQAEPEAVETVGPKTICVGDDVTWRGYKGIVAGWCETTQRFCFLHENGSSVWVGESELSPIEPEPEAKQPVITNSHYGPDISRVSFEFTQDPNTLGTTDASGCGSEYLTVECEYQLPGEEPFFVIRTTSGWSFDDPEALLVLLNSVKDAEKKCRCSLPQS